MFWEAAYNTPGFGDFHPFPRHVGSDSKDSCVPEHTCGLVSRWRCRRSPLAVFLNDRLVYGTVCVHVFVLVNPREQACQTQTPSGPKLKAGTQLRPNIDIYFKKKTFLFFFFVAIIGG